MNNASSSRRIGAFSAGALLMAGVLTTLRVIGAGEDARGTEKPVLDTVGGPSQGALFALLKPGGVLASSVSRPDARLAEQSQVRALFFLVDVSSAELTWLAGRFEAGELSASVGTVLPLSDVRLAHEMLDQPAARPRGKTVLRTDS